MKKVFGLFLLMLSVASPFLYADEICDGAMVEARQNYELGKYKKAKELCQYVMEECGSQYADVQEILGKCNKKLEEAAAAERQRRQAAQQRRI